MCWSQLTRVDHMYKKRWAGGRRKILQEGVQDTHAREIDDRWSPTSRDL
jgi:hypothetical protein